MKLRILLEMQAERELHLTGTTICWKDAFVATTKWSREAAGQYYCYCAIRRRFYGFMPVTQPMNHKFHCCSFAGPILRRQIFITEFICNCFFSSNTNARQSNANQSETGSNSSIWFSEVAFNMDNYVLAGVGVLVLGKDWLSLHMIMGWHDQGLY